MGLAPLAMGEALAVMAKMAKAIRIVFDVIMKASGWNIRGLHFKSKSDGLNTRNGCGR